MIREDAELRPLDPEEISRLTAGGRDRHRRTSSNKSANVGSCGGSRGAMATQVRTESPSQDPSDFGHVQARAWAGQVRDAHMEPYVPYTPVVTTSLHLVFQDSRKFSGGTGI